MRFDKVTKTNERLEIKIVFSDSEYVDVMSIIESIRNLTNPFPDRGVNSVYYDTSYFKDAKENLIGISSRRKRRLRFYNSPGDSKFYSASFEEKIKNNKLGHKLTYKSNKSDFFDTLDLSNPIVYDNSNLSDNLRPTSYVKYSRSYYSYFETVRLTVDQDIAFASLINVDQFSYNIRTNYFPRIIVEVKFDPCDYSIAKKILNRFHRAPVRHSKYLSSLAEYGYFQYL